MTVSAHDFSNSSMRARYATMVEVFERFDPAIVIIDRSITPLWYFLGLFGNLLSACIWMKPKVRRNNSSAVYLAALSVWDLLFLAMHPFQEVREAWGHYDENMLNCTLIPVLLLTAQYLSPALVLCFTVERWIAICFPFRRESLCTPRRACLVTFAMIAAIGLWSLISLAFRYYNTATNTCVFNTENNPIWTVYSIITETLFSGLVPITALAFNLLVVRELRRIMDSSKRFTPAVVASGGGGGGGGSSDSADLLADSVERRFRSTTVMLVCVSFFVILTSLPAGMVYALQNTNDFGNDTLPDELVLTDPKWRSYFLSVRIKKVIDEVSISHYSLNFLIYLLTGPQYRAHARDIVCRLLQTALLVCCCGCLRRAKQRREKLREREVYYLTNTSTDRARRFARQGRNCQEPAPMAQHQQQQQQPSTEPSPPKAPVAALQTGDGSGETSETGQTPLLHQTD